VVAGRVLCGAGGVFLVLWWFCCVWGGVVLGCGGGGGGGGGGGVKIMFISCLCLGIFMDAVELFVGTCAQITDYVIHVIQGLAELHTSVVIIELSTYSGSNNDLIC